MRRQRQQLRRVRQARSAGQAGREQRQAARTTHLWQLLDLAWRVGRRGGGWVILGTAAVVVALGMVAARPVGARAVTAGASGPTYTLPRAQPPKALPATGRWVDPAHGTAFTLRLSAAEGVAKFVAAAGKPGQFTFATPTGDQVQGFAPLTRLADGSISQGTPPSGTGACGQGQLLANTTSTPIVFRLVARLDQYALVAYARITYAEIRDEGTAAALCGGKDGPNTYEMDSGCGPDTCTDPLGTAGPAVTSYDTAVVAAAKQGGSAWDAVYTLTARTVTGQYSRAEFAATLDGQAKSAGSIQAISAPETAPEVQIDAAGQAYFAVTQTVTTELNGKTTDRQVTSYYLLEGGAWQFWFSA